MTTRPLLFLDVNGTLFPLGFHDFDTTRLVRAGNGYTLKEPVAWFEANRDAVDVVWASAGGLGNCIAFANAFGIKPSKSISPGEMDGSAQTPKLAAIQSWLDKNLDRVNDPLIWADDELSEDALAWGKWRNDNVAPTLLLSVSRWDGWTQADSDTIDAFMGSLA